MNDLGFKSKKSDTPQNISSRVICDKGIQDIPSRSPGITFHELPRSEDLKKLDKLRDWLNSFMNPSGFEKNHPKPWSNIDTEDGGFVSVDSNGAVMAIFGPISAKAVKEYASNRVRESL